MTESNTNDRFSLTTALRLVISTTLRLAIPSIGGTIIGVVLDNILGSAPLWTIVGVAVGVLTAVFLVWLQIKRERKA